MTDENVAIAEQYLNDVVIAISLHERNGTFHVSESMYY